MYSLLKKGELKMVKFGKIFFIILFLISCNTTEKAESQKRLPLNSHEHKLLLNAKKFENLEEAFSEYWEIVKLVAIKQNLKVVEFENKFKQKNRIVHFYDTKNFDLRKNGFLLRKRTKLYGDKPDSNFTLTIKFIHDEFNKAASTDLKLGAGYIPKDSVLVVEADIVNGKKADSNPTVFYSTQNTTILNKEPGELLADYAKIFPIIKLLSIDLSLNLAPVNGIEAMEYNIKPGLIDFGNELFGEVGISVREINGQKIPEFSFDHSMEGWKEIPEKSKKHCESFIRHLQAKEPDWFVDGKLKTSFVFNQ